MRRPRGVDTAGMVGLVRFVNDATQHSVCDDTNVDALLVPAAWVLYWHENPAACPFAELPATVVAVVRYLCELLYLVA